MAIKFEDPFRGSSLFSLLPKTLTASFRAQITDSKPDDLESVKSYFKSMVVTRSTPIAQQAQTITKNYPDVRNLHPEDGSFAANCKDRHPERRPALGRKRARFSLNPAACHSLPNIDISSSIDHIDDPEEYFLAFEQLEKAEKELKKLRGEVDPLQCYQDTTARKRRPGLRGKTASYKHHNSANVETAETIVESQERHLNSIDAGPCNLFHLKPVDEPAASQAENTKSKLKESTEHEGSVVEKEGRVGNLLKECLTSFKHLDVDEGETFLRKSLQVKPKDASVCRLSLPTIQLNQHSVFNNRAIHGKFYNSQILSPSTKSPLQAVSSLQRRSLKDPLKDLYPFSPADESPCSGGSSSKSPGKKSLTPVIVSNHDDSGFLFDDASSPVADNGTRLGFEDGICSPVVELDKSMHHRCISEERFSKLPNPVLEIKTNSNPITVSNENGSISDESVGSLQEDNDVLVDPVITDESKTELKGCNSQPRIQEIIEYPSQLLGEDANCNSHAGDRSKDILGGFDGGLLVEGDNLQLDQPDAGVAEYSITSLADAGVGVMTSTCANQTTTGSLENPLSKMGGNSSIPVTDMPQSEVNVAVKEKLSDAKTSKGNSYPPETVLSDGHLQNLHSLPDEYNEERQIASGPYPNEGIIQKAPPPHRRYKNKYLIGRTSLAGGGTIWEDGRRKSSRRKFRPLEHWLGERLLYGRIHSTLATVIGVKYASPGKNNLKVESCVSEEYAELVAQAARC